jgi:hypothetical protein
MGVGGQRHAPAALPPGKTRYLLYKRLGVPRAGLLWGGDEIEFICILSTYPRYLTPLVTYLLLIYLRTYLIIYSLTHSLTHSLNEAQSFLRS